jgi:salicylate hydroxylase
MDKVLADPYLRELYKDGKAGFRINLDFADDVLFINYQCRSDTMLNCAFVHNTRKDQDESDVWNSQASVAKVLETCRNFHPVLKRYVELCEDEDIKVHHAVKRPPLPSFVNGRALVLGDAAHVMLPTHAAGLTIAVESAAALEPIMSGVKAGDIETIKVRLKVWNKLRNGRCNFAMIMSNAGPGGLNVPGVEDEIRKYYDGKLPPKEAFLWTEKSREVFFDCDALTEAKLAMQREGLVV